MAVGFGGKVVVEILIRRNYLRWGVPGGSRGSGELFLASPLANKSQDKTPGVFFHAAFDFDTAGP